MSEKESMESFFLRTSERTWMGSDPIVSLVDIPVFELELKIHHGQRPVETFMLSATYPLKLKMPEPELVYPTRLETESKALR